MNFVGPKIFSKFVRNSGASKNSVHCTYKFENAFNGDYLSNGGEEQHKFHGKFYISTYSFRTWHFIIIVIRFEEYDSKNAKL